MVVGLLTLLFAAPLVGETKTPAFSSDPASVKSRLENVRRLVTTSSGAKRIAAGDNTMAKSGQATAQAHLQKAEKAYQSEDMTGAQAELQLATETMFGAIREMGTGKEGVEKKHREFDKKAESVETLLTAVERVAREKGGLPKVEARAREIRSKAAEAQRLEKAGKAEQAGSLLNTAYEEAKVELERLREGETLVRTLEFANAEEEYHYELDRNDTHQMLLKVLLEDKGEQAGAKKLIDGYVGKSGELRTRAEREAAGGDHERAVKSLEEATRYLQRAIRSAGVYIPG
jgi:hypothetical protein